MKCTSPTCSCRNQALQRGLAIHSLHSDSCLSASQGFSTRRTVFAEMPFLTCCPCYLNFEPPTEVHFIYIYGYLFSNSCFCGPPFIIKARNSTRSSFCKAGSKIVRYCFFLVWKTLDHAVVLFKIIYNLAQQLFRSDFTPELLKFQWIP